MSAALPVEWRPTDEDRQLLAADYGRQGIEPGTEDSRLVSLVVGFICKAIGASR